MASHSRHPGLSRSLKDCRPIRTGATVTMTLFARSTALVPLGTSAAHRRYQTIPECSTQGLKAPRHNILEDAIYFRFTQLSKNQHGQAHLAINPTRSLLRDWGQAQLRKPNPKPSGTVATDQRLTLARVEGGILLAFRGDCQQGRIEFLTRWQLRFGYPQSGPSRVAGMCIRSLLAASPTEDTVRPAAQRAAVPCRLGETDLL
jgi:hypothetical protein